MKAQQILQAIGPELRQQILTYIQTDERPAYRALIQSLAQARKLRPQFILEKSRAQQAEWLLNQLYLKSNDPVAEQLLQIWLLKSQGAMLITFLDAVGITHDGKGQVDELPEEISEEKAQAGIDALLKDYGPQQVALYLHMFQIQRPEGWAGLTTAMEKTEAIKL
ncbi:hypothetical protein SAMN02745166_01830 [Prosthecobacter debontii]|uniref:Uncharacterized protein n=1 Tax=Prosthecobacter debontii TaxID=48467 RepID=A0A1T4XR91_9BACT|nr:hypothetical protein [Prosthecobacter debontii]SKA92067.1 hypothetical protein SAMN02745166_01830 [Prosthecobacter debontii]